MAVAVDGYWGGDTIWALKVHYFPSPFDNHVHNQYTPNILANPGLVESCWEHSYNVSQGGDGLVRIIQEKVGAPAIDGIMGTDTIRALQVKMGTTVDGRLDAGSECIKALQRRINDGRFLD